MKQYNFKLIYKRYNKTTNIIKNSVILFFLLVLTTVVMLYCFGKFQIFHVLTSSSAPYHPAGSLAIDVKTNFDDLKVGDFITYSTTGGRSFITHEIVKIDKENKTVTTSQQKRDDDGRLLSAEERLNLGGCVDAPINESQYYGKVLFSIPKLGLWLTSIKGLVLNGNSLNILGIISIVLAYFVYYFLGKLLYTPTYVLKEKRNWQKQKNLKE